MDKLRTYIRLEIAEGKKLNVTLAAALALGTPAAIKQSAIDRAAGHAERRQQPPPESVLKTPPAKRKPDRPKAPTEPGQTKSSTTANQREYTRKEIATLIEKAARDADISPAFLDAIAKVESNYNPRAVSPAGAQGMMQFMPSTARFMKLEDPFDPGQAIPAGARYLKKLLKFCDDDYELAAAAYNAGPHNVEKYGGVPPFAETQAYVKKVAKAMAESSFNRTDD